MTIAKVSQKEADAYLDGWGAYHNGQHLKDALAMSAIGGDRALEKLFVEGYEDCCKGNINFEKCMGPDDFNEGHECA